MELTDRIAVITGAGSGIGRALAIRSAERGARFVVCTDLNGENAIETAAMIGSGASGHALDVGDEKAIEALDAEVESTIGGIDVFVSNAGYGLFGDALKSSGKSNSTQASGDGILEPEVVADACIEAMAEGRFLVLPHPEVATYFQRKASDYDRWLGGMRRLKAKLTR